MKFFSKLKQFAHDMRNTPLLGYYRPTGDHDDHIEIPLTDIRESDNVALATQHKALAVDFLAKMSRGFGKLTRFLLPPVLPLMDYLSHQWLKKTNNPYLEEIEATAKAVGKPGVYMMSLSYEWGCTSGAYAISPTNVMIARVMDWPFPLLGDNLVVAHQKGAAGEFYNVTWPGYNGVVQAMAPGRFAAAINQAPRDKTIKSGLKNWLTGRLHINKAKEGTLPPPHALRKAFEQAASYDEAKKILMETPLTSPSIFTLTGTKEGEGCVIERTADKAYVREMTAGRVTVGNMFESELKDNGQQWACRRGDSLLRSAYARSVSNDDVAAIGSFPWFDNAPAETCLRSFFSRVVMTADAKEGTLQVMGTAGEKAVTKVFRLVHKPS